MNKHVAEESGLPNVSLCRWASN